MLISDQNTIEFLISDDQKRKLRDYGFFLNSQPSGFNSLNQHIRYVFGQQISVEDADISKLSDDFDHPDVNNRVVNLLLLMLINAENIIDCDESVTELKHIYTVYGGLNAKQKALLKKKYLKTSIRSDLSKKILVSLETSHQYINHLPFSSLEPIRGLQLILKEPKFNDNPVCIFDPSWIHSVSLCLTKLINQNDILAKFWPEDRDVFVSSLEFLDSNSQAVDEFDNNKSLYFSALRSFENFSKHCNELLACGFEDDYPEIKKALTRLSSLIEEFLQINQTLFLDWPELANLYAMYIMEAHQRWGQDDHYINGLQKKYINIDIQDYNTIRVYIQNPNYLYNDEDLFKNKNSQKALSDISRQKVMETKNAIENASKLVRNFLKTSKFFEKTLKKCADHKFHALGMMETLRQTCYDLDLKICQQLNSTIFNWNKDITKNLRFFDNISDGLELVKIKFFKSYLENVFEFQHTMALGLSTSTKENLWINEFENNLACFKPFIREFHNRFYRKPIDQRQLYFNIVEYLYCFKHPTSNWKVQNCSSALTQTLDKINEFLSNFDMEIYKIKPHQSMLLSLMSLSKLQEFTSIDDLDNISLGKITNKIKLADQEQNIKKYYKEKLFVGPKDHPPVLNFSKKRLRHFIENSTDNSVYMNILMKEIQLFLGIHSTVKHHHAKVFESNFIQLRQEQLQSHLYYHMETHDVSNQIIVIPRDWRMAFIYRGRYYEYNAGYDYYYHQLKLKAQDGTIQTSLEPVLHDFGLHNNRLHYLMGYCRPLTEQQAEEYVPYTPEIDTMDPGIREQQPAIQLTASNPCANNCITGLQLIREVLL